MANEFLNKIMTADVIDGLKKLPDGYFHTIVSSPPYWAVRDYQIEPTSFPEVTYTLFGMIEITVPAMSCQLGHEKSPEHFIGHMVYIFRELRRVLRDDGTLWMNMGDCYNSKSGGYKNASQHGYHTYIAEGTAQATMKINRNLKNMGLKQKDQVGIPWLLAFALRSDGWYLRQDIIWHKKNPMPESVNDRCTKAHEYIFLFSKSKKYFYDAYAISTEIVDSSVKRLTQDLSNQKGSDRAAGGMKHNGTMKAVLPKHNSIKGYDHKADKSGGLTGHSGYVNKDGELIGNGRANKKSVWTVNNKGTTEKHFATYPEELVFDPIKAGTSEHGCCETCGAPYIRTFDKKDWISSCKCNAGIVPCRVLDPFAGRNTTGVVSGKLGRNWVSIEKNPQYVAIGENYSYKELGLFR
jgi:DNA modification methylase